MECATLDYLQSFFGEDVEVCWQGDDLLASGPMGKKLYRQIDPTSIMKQAIGEDEFYIDTYKPEYDLSLLRDRILGDLVQPVPPRPLGGHAVKLADGAHWEWVTSTDGLMATVDGSCGSIQGGNGVDMVFATYGHRGAGTRYSFNDDRAFCSCSGGPCPRNVPVGEFQYSGEYVERWFWRWRDGAEGNGGEDYCLRVPLWIWTPAHQ